ncbi:HD domain-containing protein [Megamonas hypermegale]|uniref:HD domain-containing protein n=1 Tax=Megamonas hypermegale TaxID=158847 RepID=UPI0026F17FDB|nr:HD domain-containing protein [Megamonas hypermegale]
MDLLHELTLSMIKYYQGDPKRIQHFIKVHSFARLIGIGEKLDADTLFVLEAAALTHDIGIKPAKAKFNSSGGKFQEQEGPAPARKMLTELGFDENVIDRVCYLIAHHHTYTDINGMDYQILVEADFIVNLYEDSLPKKSVQTALERIFRTETGKCLCKTVFDI